MESETVHQELCTVIKRRHCTQSNFDLLNNHERQKLSVREHLGNKIKACCSPSYDCFKKALLSFFPFVGIMAKYRIRRDLLCDVASGLTVGVMHIPQGMAYGMLANVDPVYGLYTSFFPVIVYFFLGTSLHISLGTFAVVSLMLGGVVDKSDCFHEYSVNRNSSVSSNKEAFSEMNFSGNWNHMNNVTHSHDDEFLLKHDFLMCKVGYVMAVSMMASIYQFFMGLFRFGFVTIYLLDPLTRALTTGAAVHVFTSQIKHAFAINTGRFAGPLKLVYTYIDFFKKITQTNPASVVMAVTCIIVIYSSQRWVSPRVQKKLKVPLPVELIVLILSTLISYLAKFSSKSVFGMKVVGEIPTGFPPPAFPPVNIFHSVAVDAIGIAIVSFTINISMAKMFSKKHGYPLDSNQELMAYGITNFISSICNAYISTASLSRSVVQEAVGGKTQVAGLVSCCLLLVVLLAVGPLFRELPNCVLAAIIIVNLRGVFLQVKDLPMLLKISVTDMMIWLVTFIAVVLTDVDLGLLIGVVFSLLTVVFRTQRVHTCILGRIPHTDVYEDIKKYPSAKEINRIKIFRFNSSLCYTNVDHFLEKLYKKTLCNPVEIKAALRSVIGAAKKSEPNASTELQPIRVDETVVEGGELNLPSLSVTHIIIDCTSMVFMDAVGAATLKQVINDYHAVDVRVFFARCNEEIYDILKTFEPPGCKDTDLTKRLKIFPTVQDAVMAAVDQDSRIQKQFVDIHGSIVTGLDYVGNAVDQINGVAVSPSQSQESVLKKEKDHSADSSV